MSRQSITNRVRTARAHYNRIAQRGKEQKRDDARERAMRETMEEVKRERVLYEARRQAITNAPIQMETVQGYVLGAEHNGGCDISWQNVPLGLTKTQYEQWLDSNVRNAFPLPFGEAKPGFSVNHRLVGVHSQWKPEGIETTNDISILLRGFLRKMEMRYGIKFPEPLCVFEMGDRCGYKRSHPPANGEPVTNLCVGGILSGYVPLYEGFPAELTFECETKAGDIVFSLKSVKSRLVKPWALEFSISSERWKNYKDAGSWSDAAERMKSYMLNTSLLHTPFVVVGHPYQFAKEPDDSSYKWKWEDVTLFDLTNSFKAFRPVPTLVRSETIGRLPKADFQEWLRFDRLEKRTKLRAAVKEYSELLNLPAGVD